jgi:hypothetical protein
MAGFTFKLEHEDGTPADPPTLHAVVPNWRAATRSRTGGYVSAPFVQQPDRPTQRVQAVARRERNQ